MKKQINPTIKAYLVRSGFYLLLLLAVCAIPFALAQSRSRGTATAVAKSDPAAKTNQQHAAPPSSGAIGALAIPARDQSHLPKVSSGPIGVPSFRMPPAPKVPQVVLYDQYNNASDHRQFVGDVHGFPDFQLGSGRRLCRAGRSDLECAVDRRRWRVLQWRRTCHQLECVYLYQQRRASRYASLQHAKPGSDAGWHDLHGKSGPCGSPRCWHILDRDPG